ncbi:MAG TPA: helix-turn-helix transcriptional regulator [Mucilaginibacter sp.]|jgi:ribosome-binding protein aMBF1 (putative translation factor)
MFFFNCGQIRPQFLYFNQSISFLNFSLKTKSILSQLTERFGEHLKKIREARGLSLRDLELRCELDNSKISKIENGKFNIQLSTIFELAKGLGVEPKELLDFKI